MIIYELSRKCLIRIIFLLRDSYDSKTIIAFRSNFNHEIDCVLFGNLQLDCIFSKSKKSKKIGNIFNIVEDVHIEREVDKKCRIMLIN